MKRLLFIIISVTISIAYNSRLAAQSTATDFTLTDCNGKSCKLFDVLDSGHIVVMCWVMPCGNCTNGASKSFTAAKDKQGNAQHKVYYYLVDDIGNSACSTLTTWGAGNGVDMSASYVRSFSNSGNAINMTNYGTAGMPKAIVMAGPSHKVYYNVNGSTAINTTIMKDSIDKAIAEMNAAGVNKSLSAGEVLLSPNPVSSEIHVKAAFFVEQITIKDISGKEIMSQTLDNSQTAHVASLPEGIYFVQCFAADHRIETIKIIKY